jgi:membrane protease YdiL (CAAX protease family)
MINTPIKELEEPEEQMHPGMQFLVLAAVFLVIFIVCNIIGVAIAGGLYGFKILQDIGTVDAATPHIASALWIIQLTGTTLPILAAPVFFAYVIVNDPGDYIKPNFDFSWGLIGLGLCIMLLSLPTIELLSNINQQLQLPHFLSGVQKWMEDSEKEADKLTAVMLQMNTIRDLVIDILLIGLVTAIVEEFMFRGVLQTIFARWTQSYHAAIWITAILFSAFHMEFFGFLPRVLLGALFGYFVVWSGSIWPAVWGHFVNNATDVILTYLEQHKIIKIADDQHIFNKAEYVISFALGLAVMLVYHKIATGRQQQLLVEE